VLLGAGFAGALLVGWAFVASVLGWQATVRRDVA
jgi:hypothetical protein